MPPSVVPDAQRAGGRSGLAVGHSLELLAEGLFDFVGHRHPVDRGQGLQGQGAKPVEGPLFVFPLAGNATANLARNLWAFTIIFCGHFPEGTHEFSEEETEDETRGEWYYRQVLGSANLSGGPLFHILSGNLSFQIEHHLFPDLPANRYADISVDVQEACERYGIPYNVGPLHRQFGSVVAKIFRLSLPESPSRLGGIVKSAAGKLKP